MPILVWVFLLCHCHNNFVLFVSFDSSITYKDVIERLKEYRAYGAKIILFTSRNMNTYNGNLGLINKNTAKVLSDWLEKWDIPYDEIYYGKPWPGHNGFYVDDRCVRPDEFVKCSVEELCAICQKAKME